MRRKLFGLSNDKFINRRLSRGTFVFLIMSNTAHRFIMFNDGKMLFNVAWPIEDDLFKF